MRKIILCKFDFRVEIVSVKWMPFVEPGGVAAGQRGGGERHAARLREQQHLVEEKKIILRPWGN